MAKKARSKKAPAHKRKVAAKRITPPAIVLQASDVPAMGKPWAGRNGIRIGEFAGENGKPGYHLLLATDAAGNPIILDSKTWGEFGKDVPGAASLNDGAANTDAMIAAGSAVAKAARAHGEDCYVPSLCELQSAFAHARELLPKEWLWSSTQYSANCAWLQDFRSGTTYFWSKDNRFRAFVVRRVPIQGQ